MAWADNSGAGVDGMTDGRDWSLAAQSGEVQGSSSGSGSSGWKANAAQ
ncbi:hypothetical protein GCM10010278_37380 [Streptomyces melanogenes]|nr:hypothetical protein GCM10010278_37380 [Streptomyces melanogenes]